MGLCCPKNTGLCPIICKYYFNDIDVYWAFAVRFRWREEMKEKGFTFYTSDDKKIYLHFKQRDDDRWECVLENETLHDIDTLLSGKGFKK